MINLDKPNTNYLAPISPILFSIYLFNNKLNYSNLINLDKPNNKYLVPISPILFLIYLILNLNLNIII